MAQRILIQPDQIWNYFQIHRESLPYISAVVAENDDFGIIVYLTADKDLPFFSVEQDGVPVYGEGVVSARDCTDTAEEIVETYTTQKVVSVLAGEVTGEDDYDDDDPFGDDPYESEESIEEMTIDDREMQLDGAIMDMLEVIYADIYGEDDRSYMIDSDMVEEVKDHICAYLHQKYDADIYRPMYLDFDDGTTEYMEYPYESLELEEVKETVST